MLKEGLNDDDEIQLMQEGRIPRYLIHIKNYMLHKDNKHSY